MVFLGFARPVPRPGTEREGGASIELARRVRSIFAGRCFRCHGPDDAVRQAGLRLDTRDGPMALLEDGRVAVVPGDPEKSEIMARLTHADPGKRMPPPEVSQHGLDPEQVDAVRQWIRDGARWANHWSFDPPVRQPPPAVARESWCRDDLDRWVLARLEREGLDPSAEAERASLLRRASLDLIGLPPSPAELDAFLADAGPDAYERAIDRLLASPHFGERWARWWLDLARYADTKGYEKDERRSMWPYRDWLIRAFNDDMPFDRFTVEQLAGDLLDAPTRDQLLATAFHRNTMTNDEGGTDDEEFRVAAVIDRVNTTFEVWQGLTIACAQCHTHKFDPLLHTDYYRAFAIFNNTRDADRPDEAPTIRLAPEEVEAELSSIDEAIRDAWPERHLEPPASPSPEIGARLDTLRGRRDQLEKGVANVPVMRELHADRSRVTRRFVRGSFLDPAETVEPGVPAVLAPSLPRHPSNRLAFARWLVSEDNPLTARVITNRIWEQLFGTGIVETLEDFGVQGTPPSHPELLDDLAIRFRDEGWSVKALLRRITTSATYRQSSRVRPELLERDPGNRLLARGPRFRLDAETLRDQALAASGLLSPRMYGPSVFPPQPDGLWIMIYSGDRWRESEGEDRHRRALYTFWRRTVPYPSMTTFDAPSREFCVSRRGRTNTPLQAFVTLNDPAFVECAQGLGRRVLREAGPDPSARITLAFRLVVCRGPTQEEAREIGALLAEQREHFAADPSAAVGAATNPIGPAPEGADLAELASWSVVGSVLLNLDEAMTKE